MHETSHNCRGRDTDHRRLTPGGRHDRHPLVTLLPWLVWPVTEQLADKPTRRLVNSPKFLIQNWSV